MLAFILLASRLGRPVSQSDVAACTRYDMAELLFEPDQYLGWHSTDRRLHLFAWQAFSEQGQIGSHWFVDHDQVVLFSGTPIPLDTPWTPGASWADQLARQIAESDANTVVAGLGGAFTLLHLQKEADSIATNDLLGGAPLYWDASQEILVISNHANLVASVWEQPGTHAVRDWRGPTWPLFLGESFDCDTGFKDAVALPPGAWWNLGWQARPEEEMRSLPSPSGGSVADRIETTLRRSLRAIATLPFQQCALKLDGSKASRLLLGLLASEQLLDRVALTATGSPDDPTIRIATELADRVGRPLLVQNHSLSDPDDFLRQARIQSFQTSGIGSLWERAGLLGSKDIVQIESSLAGLLTPNQHQRALLTGQETFDRLGILQPQIATFFAERIATALEKSDRGQQPPVALAANPRSIASAVAGSVIAHAYPYLDPEIQNALSQLDTDELLAESVYTTLMARVAPDLLTIDVCDEVNPRDYRVLDFETLAPLFEDYLLDPTNPIQDLIDAEKVAVMLADPEQTPEMVRAFYDLLGIAIWLGQDEQVAKIHRADEIGVRGVFSPLDRARSMVRGDESLLPQLDISVRHRATDQLLDSWLKLDKAGTHLTADAKILGVIPYYEAEEYLEAAIDSLIRQSRPLQGIVVIDDVSSTPPTKTLEKFPGVTLLRSAENSGPYRLIQEVIDNTGYDAFLFQDADDWSAPDRLEVLLDLATRTGKELIGSQGHRLIVDEGEVVLYQHPIDPERTFQTTPKSKPVHHPTSLVTRDLIQRTGGYCTGLPYSGDTEFLRRAATIGPIGNTAEFIYIYRTRSDSLTGSEETGVHTAVRRELWAIQHPRAQWISDRVQAGLGPVLAPMAMTSPANLAHLSGPALLGVDGQPWPIGTPVALDSSKPRKKTTRRKSAATPPRPVFIIGAPRSGTSILALAISQLPVFKLALDPGWLANLSSSLHIAFDSVELADNVNDLEIQRIDTEQFAAHFGAAAHALILKGIDPEVAAPFEDERLRQLRTKVERTSTRVLAEGDILAEHGFDLHRLFPHAKFIHVLREPDEVVAAHQKDRRMLYRSRFVYMDEEKAYDRWIETVQAARSLEIALGAEKVMRVERATLMTDPETILRQVLAFIEEPFDPIVLRPFV